MRRGLPSPKSAAGCPRTTSCLGKWQRREFSRRGSRAEDGNCILSPFVPVHSDVPREAVDAGSMMPKAQHSEVSRLLGCPDGGVFVLVIAVVVVDVSERTRVPDSWYTVRSTKSTCHANGTATNLHLRAVAF